MSEGHETPCDTCRHPQRAHDYSDLSSDWAPCRVTGCKCKDWEEPEPHDPDENPGPEEVDL